MSLCISAGLNDGFYAGIHDPCVNPLGANNWSEVPHLEDYRGLRNGKIPADPISGLTQALTIGHDRPVFLDFDL